MAKGGLVGPKAENTAQHQNIRGLVCHGKAFELYLKGSRELLEDLNTGVTQTDFGVRIKLQLSIDCLCAPNSPTLEWHPTPALLPGKSHRWRSLVGCSPWGHEESDTTE